MAARCRLQARGEQKVFVAEPAQRRFGRRFCRALEMGLGRLSLIALLTLATPASARTFSVAPDPCPAAPTAPSIVFLDGEEALALDIRSDVIVLYPVRKGWASARLLMRFDLEGAAPEGPTLNCETARPRRIRLDPAQ